MRVTHDQLELDGATISQTLRTAFAGHGIALAPASVVVVVKPGERWFVTDHSTLYPILKQGGGAPRVLALAYQTGKSAEELRASPEHVNPAAYAALRAALRDPRAGRDPDRGRPPRASCSVRPLRACGAVPSPL